MKKTYIIIAVLFTVGIFIGRAQTRTPLPGMTGDTVYMQLIEMETILQIKEDSLSREMENIRALLRTEPERRQIISEEIIRLEGEMFDVWNQAGIVSGRIGSMEQEYIIGTMYMAGNPDNRDLNEPVTHSVSVEYPDLIKNPVFQENLPAEDFNLLAGINEREVELSGLLLLYLENYKKASDIADLYDRVDNAREADSLYSEFEMLSQYTAGLENDIRSTWEAIADIRLYCYSYLADKLDKSRTLSSIDPSRAESRENIIYAVKEGNIGVLAEYAYGRKLIIDTELSLAQELHLTRAADSIRKINIDFKPENYLLPELFIEEKLFLDYQDIEITAASKYNTRNPIPELTVYAKGTIYRILLGSYTRQQQPSVFRNAYPIGYYVTGEGRYEYYAGGFRSYIEAEAAKEKLIRAGFRDPKITVWTGPQYDSVSQDAVSYCIEIDTAGSDLDNAVRELIQTVQGVEISRADAIFIVAPFDDSGEAEKLAAAIRDGFQGLKATVVPIVL